MQRHSKPIAEAQAVLEAPNQAVHLNKISKYFGETRALDGVELVIYEGEFFAMLGPSGSGKTTCLRVIAGFEQPSAGEISIFEEEASAIPPYRRKVNTVFQDYALFPHLNVEDNVSYGLKIKGVSKEQQRQAAEQALALVRLPGYGHRKPGQLSGGQRQRVALARALVNKPKVLLLDEPLGALDLKLREEMQEELKELQRKLGITFVFVTHDQGEALSMADRIAVFNKGKIVQVGAPQELYHRPDNEFIANFVGSSNILPAELVAKLVGQHCPASLRPEAVRLVNAGGHAATVTGASFLGASVKVSLQMGDLRLNALLENSASLPQVGQRVHIDWKRSDLHLMEKSKDE